MRRHTRRNRLQSIYHPLVNPKSERRPSGAWTLASLLAANLLPLAGVYLWGWSLTDLLLLYWLENAVVGLYTVMTLLAAWPEDRSRWSRVAAKVFTVPFFVVHYGMFWIGHGIFLLAFFGGDMRTVPNQAQGFFLAPILESWQRFDVLIWPVAAMLVSHGIAFLINFLASGEYRNSKVNELMMRPYGRVVILHVTIVAGGFLALLLGPSLAVLLLFVTVKIVADVFGYLRASRRVSQLEAVAV